MYIYIIFYMYYTYNDFIMTGPAKTLSNNAWMVALPISQFLSPAGNFAWPGSTAGLLSPMSWR